MAQGHFFHTSVFLLYLHKQHLQFRIAGSEPQVVSVGPKLDMVGNKAVQRAGVAAYHAVRLGEGKRGFKAAVAEPKPAAAVSHVKRFVVSCHA